MSRNLYGTIFHSPAKNHGIYYLKENTQFLSRVHFSSAKSRGANHARSFIMISGNYHEKFIFQLPYLRSLLILRLSVIHENNTEIKTLTSFDKLLKSPRCHSFSFTSSCIPGLVKRHFPRAFSRGFKVQHDNEYSEINGQILYDHLCVKGTTLSNFQNGAAIPRSSGCNFKMAGLGSCRFCQITPPSGTCVLSNL